MRILYAATDQTVPGTTGGSVHVRAVAEGLARLGHDVHALVTPGKAAFPGRRVHWYGLRPPLGARQLRLLRARRVRDLARRLRPHVVIERYYNFGGEGLLAARDVGALAVLEVNAPVIDHPGSARARLDRLLMVEPLRRWRERQCRMADLFITPMPAILPASVPRGRIIEAEWGVDTDRFRPDIAEAAPFLRASGDVVVVFAGAFRAWHGAIHLVKAIEALRRRGRRHIKAVFAGTGPEEARVRSAAGALDGLTFLGPLPHEQMPACLAAADIGAAPFDVSAHPPLSLGFYWSPLKVFEYMASGLPVVAPRIGRLERILSGGDLGTGPAGMADVGTAGVLYDADGPTALAGAIEQLADDPARRAALGRSARARAVHEFSWDAHCRILEDAFQRAGRRRGGGHTCVS